MGVERSQSAQAIRRFPTVFDRKRRQVLQPCYAFLVLASAVVVTVLPAQPVDVAQAMPAPKLPRFIDGLAADARPLTPREQIYFTRYGGGAARASYDDYGLLMVRTSAPLRHLHGPDECLRGAGHQVRYLGSIYAPLPTAVYRSVDPQGQTWRIAVSFISSRGEITTSVAHAVWLWMQHPGTAWTQVQRVTPWDADPARQWAWDRAVARALDLPVTRDRRDVNFAVFTKPLESKSAQIININKNIEL